MAEEQGAGARTGGDHRGCSARRALALWAAYTAIGLIFTWPLVAHLTTHIPGVGGDAYAFLWSVWWPQHQAYGLRGALYHTDLLFHPFGTSLAFHTLSLMNGLLAGPLVTLAGPTVGFNAVFLLGLGLAGCGMYWLARDLGARAPAAFLAGAVFSFSPIRMVRSEGHLNIFSIQWLPFFILFLLRLLDGRRPAWKWAVAAGAALAAAALSSWYYLIYSLFLAVFFTLADRQAWRSARLLARRAGRTTLALAAGGLILAPALAPIVPELARDSTPLYAGHSEEYSVDLASYLLPNHLNPLLGGLARGLAGRSGTFHGNRCEGMAALGYVGLALAIAGSIRNPAARRWRWLGLAAAAFSLGPVVHIAGRRLDWLPGPFRLLLALPIAAGARVPGRFAVIAALAVAVLAAFGLTRILDGLQSAGRPRTARIAAGVCIAAALLELAPAPIRICSTRVAGLMARVRDDPGYAAILEWPTGPHLAMARQTFHGKAILDAFHARPIYAHHQARALRDTIVRAILLAPAADVFDPPASPFALARFHDVGAVVIDLALLPEAEPDPGRRAALLAQARTALREPPRWADEEAEIYVLDSPELAFSPPLAEDGWGDPLEHGGRLGRPMQSASAALRLVARRPFAEVEVEIDLAAGADGGPAVAWFLDGEPWPADRIAGDAGARTWRLAPVSLAAGVHELRLAAAAADELVLTGVRLRPAAAF